MAIQRTLGIIKPDAYISGNIGNIIAMIESNGFKIVHALLYKFTKKAAKQFYHAHEGKAFFDGLIEFTCSDKVLAIVLEKEKAIKDFRKLIGATEPSKASKDSIRGKYGSGLPMNAIHGSDSKEGAKQEITYIFGEFASIPSSEKDVAKEY